MWDLYLCLPNHCCLFAFFFPSVFYAHSKKSTEQMKKVPTIVLSVSYKGVKFIDATNKVAHTPKTEVPSWGVVFSQQPEWYEITWQSYEGGTNNEREINQMGEIDSLLSDRISHVLSSPPSLNGQLLRSKMGDLMGDLSHCCYTSKYKELKVKYIMKFVVRRGGQGAAA